jgi:hypothetical protein
MGQPSTRKRWPSDQERRDHEQAERNGSKASQPSLSSWQTKPRIGSLSNEPIDIKLNRFHRPLDSCAHILFEGFLPGVRFFDFLGK